MKKTYYLFNPGRLQRKDNTLKFCPYDDEGNELPSKYLPVEAVEDFYCFGALEANSALFNFLGKQGIALHFFDYYENYTGSFMPRDQLISGKMLMQQVKKHSQPAQRIILARKFIDAAAFNMVKNLRYYHSRGKDLSYPIERISLFAEKIEECRDVEQLMGIEGNIRAMYYDAFNLIIDPFEMGNRTKQPPGNEVNALISFGNMMCYSQCLRAIHQTQLNPAISFLHSPGERRYSLALDIAEIFKPVIIDRLIFKVLNRKEIQEKHFDKKLNHCVLNESGKKIFVQAYEAKLLDTLQHRILKRNVSYKHLIRLECYKLAKHILDIEEYKPFKTWW